MDLKKLTEPITYKYRLQSAKYGKATIVSYIDSRQVQDRLDEVVGAENWQDSYHTVGNNLFASISINVADAGQPPLWVTKTDVGTESNVDKEKGEVSDAFKRAAVKWGVGRFLYSLGIISLKAVKHTNDKEYPATDEGIILWSVDDLTEYCKRVVASGELDRNKRGVKPLEGAKTVPAKKETTLTDKKTDDSLDADKTKALEALGKLDTATVLKELIAGQKMKYTSILDFVKGESIEKIREVYGKLVPKK